VFLSDDGHPIDVAGAEMAKVTLDVVPPERTIFPTALGSDPKISAFAMAKPHFNRSGKSARLDILALPDFCSALAGSGCLAAQIPSRSGVAPLIAARRRILASNRTGAQRPPTNICWKQLANNKKKDQAAGTVLTEAESAVRQS